MLICLREYIVKKKIYQRIKMHKKMVQYIDMILLGGRDKKEW